MNKFDKNIPPLLISLAVATAPFIFYVRIWVICWCVLLWGYVYFSVKKGWPPRPGKMIRLSLTMCGPMGVLANSGLVIDGNTYIGLLAVMAGLKPLEIASHRDKMITIFLAYFIVITSLFVSESLSITLYMFLSVFVSTAALIHINRPGASLKANLRLSGLIIAQAVPLMIILFFLFPRLHGSLWGVKKPSLGRTGFSDSLSPGGVSDLVRSNETAFRAEFEKGIPARNLLYWRGIVFQYFDGKTWTRIEEMPLRGNALKGQNPVSYTITLEPHEERWLFALDIPAAPPRRIRMLDDYTLISRTKLMKKVRYRVTSHTAYNAGNRKKSQRMDLQLPPGRNPQARALAQKWADAAASPEAVIDTALRFFRENEFFYTLRPPLLREDSVDDFLFRTRKGYCEHYASAFVFLMRAANIPSRVVGGYLGGEVNPYGNYLIIRQSDAHAWAEVWLDKKGWVRIDPTAAVAPNRIERGLADALSPEEVPAFLSLKSLGPLAGYWKKIRFGWDAVNIQWDIWFVGYSFEQQKSLLSKIGIEVGSRKGLIKTILMGAGGAVFLIMLFSLRFVWKKSGAEKDEVQQVYEKFCRKLARIGLPREPYQGPADYAMRIRSRREDLNTAVREIIDLYILLRYGHGGDATVLKQFKYRVSHLKLRKIKEEDLNSAEALQ